MTNIINPDYSGLQTPSFGELSYENLDIETNTTVPKKPLLPKAFIVIIGVLLIISIAFGMHVYFSSKVLYDNIIDKTTQAVVTANWDDYVELLSPQQHQKVFETIDNGRFKDGNEFMSALNFGFTKQYGENFTIEILETTSQKLSASEHKAIENDYNGYYNSDVRFDECFSVNVKQKINGELVTDEYVNVLYVVANLDGDWVLFNPSLF